MSNNRSIIYGVTPTGELTWRRHVGHEDGSFNWVGPTTISSGWDDFRNVLAGDDGVVYTVQPSPTPDVSVDPTSNPASGGHLLWHRHLGRADGGSIFQGPKIVGNNWGRFLHVFGGHDGVIYAVNNAGELLWYRHTGREDGSSQWEGPRKIATGWAGFTRVFGGGDGIIYAVRPRVELDVHVNPTNNAATGGTLSWYRHPGHLDGSPSLLGPTMVGTEWDQFASVFTAGDGVIYAVRPAIEPDVSVNPTRNHASSGELLWYRHLGRDNGARKWQGPHSVGRGWDSLTSLFCGGGEPLADAAAEIDKVYRESIGILTVGSPVGSITSTLQGVYEQAYTFGTIIKPLGGPPVVGNRSHVSVSIAAIRCYGTDDPGIFVGGADEPYLISTVYTIDPAIGDAGEYTVLLDNDDLGDHEAGDVFGQNRQLANDVMVPGDGAIRIHIQLWDEEELGNPQKVKNDTSGLVKTGITAGVTAVGSAWGPAGAGVAAGALAIAEALGVLDALSEGIATLVGNVLGDNLIDQLDFVVPNDFLKALTSGDPSILNRTSSEIPGVTYNFPNRSEDDSWLFERGQGTYRVYFNITPV